MNIPRAGSAVAATVSAGATRRPGVLSRAATVLREWRELNRSRRELAALDDYQLRDLGAEQVAGAVRSREGILP